MVTIKKEYLSVLNDLQILEKEVVRRGLLLGLTLALPLDWHDTITGQPSTNQISLNTPSVPERRASLIKPETPNF